MEPVKKSCTTCVRSVYCPWKTYSACRVPMAREDFQKWEPTNAAAHSASNFEDTGTEDLKPGEWTDAPPSPPPQPRYPDDNPKTIHGLAKPPIALIPGTALVEMAQAFKDGASKYGPANWREKPVTTSTYTSAALRHLFAWIDGEETAPDSGCHHLAHAMSCLAILVDAQAQGSLNDDRPKAGKTGELIAKHTAPLA